jgi:trigger factor
VDEKDIQRMVDYIMEQHRTISPVDRASQDGDQITMDFVGVDEHKNEIEGTRSSGYQVRIGSKTLIPGFEEQLIGLKKGEEKSFEITFPEKYHAEHLRGKPATFSVNVTNIESVHLPELTDEFAKQHLDAESKDAFKERIKDSMRQQEEQLDRQKREEKLLTALVDATIVDLPEELKEQEKRAMFRELAEQLQQQGLTPEAWMEQTKRTPEQVEKELTEQSERRLKLRFGMEQALEDKQIEVTDDEVQAMIDDMMSRTPAEARAQEAARFSPGHQGYEEMKWRRRVDKFIEEMLK